jgi:putative ABC transport system substrate-binding protein
MWWSTVGVIVSLTCGLLAAPLPVGAQPVHVPRIGVLAMEGGMVTTPERFQAEFRDALRERGYVEGQTILVDYRWVAAGQADRLNDLATEFVRLPVDLIVAVSTPAAQAAKRVTLAIP